MLPMTIGKHFRNKVHIGGDDTVYGFIAYNKKSRKLEQDGKEFFEILRTGCFQWTDVACLLEHNSRDWLGSTIEGNMTIKSDSKGLYFRCKLKDTELARDIMQKVKAGRLQVSPGFIVTGESESNGTREILSAKLLELSLVTSPAYAKSSTCMSVPEHKRELEKRIAVLKWNSETQFKLNI